jgi:hypothetical protein
MELETIKYLLPDNILEEYEYDLAEFDGIAAATLILIKHYSGIDYVDTMINEFVDVFLHLSNKRMNLEKEQSERIEMNYTSALERLNKYRFANLSVSEVINVS